MLNPVALFVGSRSDQLSENPERLPRRASYAYRVDAFATAVLRRKPVKTTPEDATDTRPSSMGPIALPASRSAS